MNCQQFESRLNDLLDERAPLELDNELRGHARHCAPCRELAAGYAEMVQAVRFRRTPEPAGDLAERIVAAAIVEQIVEQPLRSDAPTRREAVTGRAGQRRMVVWHRWYGWAAASAAAAVVLLAIGWRFWPAGTRTTPPGPQQIATAPSETKETSSRPLSELAQNAAKCYAGLARETQSDLSDVLTLVPGVEGTPAAMLPSAIFPSAMWNASDAAPPSPEVASHVREGLRPLTQTTLAALTSLFGTPHPTSGSSDKLVPQDKTMPGEKSEAREKREL
jgi:hypothetical protein